METTYTVKASALVTGRRQLSAISGQWWEKTKSGKTWRLWTHDEKGLLRLLYQIPAKRVLWVIPVKEVCTGCYREPCICLPDGAPCDPE